MCEGVLGFTAVPGSLVPLVVNSHPRQAQCRHERLLRSPRGTWCWSGAAQDTVRLHPAVHPLAAWGKAARRAGWGLCAVPLHSPVPRLAVGAWQYGCAAQRHRLTQSCSKTWRCREERPEWDSEARESCVLLGAAARGLGYKSSVCLLEKHLKRGRLVSLFLHDTCL